MWATGSGEAFSFRGTQVWQIVSHVCPTDQGIFFWSGTFVFHRFENFFLPCITRVTYVSHRFGKFSLRVTREWHSCPTDLGIFFSRGTRIFHMWGMRVPRVIFFFLNIIAVNSSDCCYFEFKNCSEFQNSTHLRNLRWLIISYWKE